MNIFIPFNKVINFWIGIFLILIISLSSCGIYKPVDARKVPPNARDRAILAIEEGRGLSIGDAFGGSDGGTSYSFASSNPMWRATLEILDFLPLANVDYSGGIVSTDWYNEGTSQDESIKITVRFLSNEIRADGIKIIVHKKVCTKQQSCAVKKVVSKLEGELKSAILRKAVVFEQVNKGKIRKKQKKLRRRNN